MKYKLTFALVAALTSTAFAAFQAPLPEFKNEKQLADWRAEKAYEATCQAYAGEETAFYTGKPFLASAGGYAFKYRNYNPELARWTSEDPSGFPDGANSSIYAPIPTSGFDYMGLWRIKVTAGSKLDVPMTWSNDGKIGAQVNIERDQITDYPVDSVTFTGYGFAEKSNLLTVNTEAGGATKAGVLTVDSSGRLSMAAGGGTPQQHNGNLHVALLLEYTIAADGKSGSVHAIAQSAWSPSQLTSLGISGESGGISLTWTSTPNPEMRVETGSFSFKVVE
jgi:RHS repeat-associated protein